MYDKIVEFIYFLVKERVLQTIQMSNRYRSDNRSPLGKSNSVFLFSSSFLLYKENSLCRDSTDEAGKPYLCIRKTRLN